MTPAAAAARCTHAVRGAQLGVTKGGASAHTLGAIGRVEFPYKIRNQSGLPDDGGYQRRVQVAFDLPSGFGCLERDASSRQRLTKRPSQIDGSQKGTGQSVDGTCLD
jgi:hypothetical protein